MTDSETTAAATAAPETAAEAETEVPAYLAGPECPRCGSAAVALVELVHDSEDFRTDEYGVVPEQGQTIAECLFCQAFVVVGGEKPTPARRSSRRRIARRKRGA